MYQFNSQIKERGSFPSDYPDEIIKNEPMFFNCNIDFAYKHGGEITQDFILNLPEDWYKCNPVIDSRVHMLMPGWLPCIGGFHHDDVPRSTESGQPNYDSPEYYSEHLMGLVNGKISPTLFALGEHTLPKVEDGVISKAWHPLIEKQLQEGVLAPYEAKSGKYIEFNCHSAHTGQKAIASGWRWFIRLSRKTNRQTKISNEIRRQVQVYLDPAAGW